ncbi:MAG: hypothetical protein J0L54_03885 [Chitinophagales bacterium]|nr:hypothetical protein [Chitinophagales bacterium]
MITFDNESDFEKMDEQELRLIYCQLFNEVAIRKQVADDYARMQVILKRVEAILFKPRF